MNYIYGLIALVFLGLIFSFGIDRDIARKEYVFLINEGDWDNKIEGCLYSCNCNYYNELLEQKR